MSSKTYKEVFVPLTPALKKTMSECLRTYTDMDTHTKWPKSLIHLTLGWGYPVSVC